MPDSLLCFMRPRSTPTRRPASITTRPTPLAITMAPSTSDLVRKDIKKRPRGSFSSDISSSDDSPKRPKMEYIDSTFEFEGQGDEEEEEKYSLRNNNSLMAISVQSLTHTRMTATTPVNQVQAQQPPAEFTTLDKHGNLFLTIGGRFANRTKLTMAAMPEKNVARSFLVCSRTLARHSSVLEAKIFGGPDVNNNSLEATASGIPVLKLPCDNADAFGDILEIFHSGGLKSSTAPPPSQNMTLKRAWQILWVTNRYRCTDSIREQVKQWGLDLRRRDDVTNQPLYTLNDMFMPIHISFELGEWEIVHRWIQELVMTYQGGGVDSRFDSALRMLNCPMTPFDFRCLVAQTRENLLRKAWTSFMKFSQCAHSPRSSHCNIICTGIHGAIMGEDYKARQQSNKPWHEQKKSYLEQNDWLKRAVAGVVCVGTPAMPRGHSACDPCRKLQRFHGWDTLQMRDYVPVKYRGPIFDMR